MHYLFFYMILFFFTVACSTVGESKLEKALSGAVKEKKVTQEKMQSIIIEYNRLLENDQPIAREYFDQVIIAIEMGGDSSHIDAVRRQVLRKRTSEPEIQV